MEPTSEDIRTSFVDAYPTYVASLLTARGVDVDDTIADSIVEGASILDGLLTSLGRVDPADQTRSPLELFREALRPVSRAMDLVGIAPTPRDAGKEMAVPWDIHDLSPTSPRQLGETAHEAHLRWGVTKAAAMGAPPTRNTPRKPLILVYPRQEDVVMVRSIVEGLGYRAGLEPGDERAVAALVDADAEAADEKVRWLLAEGVRTIAYGQIDDIRAAGLTAAGVWKVASRDDVIHRLGTLLPVLG